MAHIGSSQVIPSQVTMLFVNKVLGAGDGNGDMFYQYFTLIAVNRTAVRRYSRHCGIVNQAFIPS